MYVQDALPQSPPSRGCALTFGNLDGVHLGHRAILAALRRHADAHGLEVCVVTFEPHPLRLLRPDKAPAALDTIEGRLAWLEAEGVDRAVVLRFDAALAQWSPERFAAALYDQLRARLIVVGEDARFGRRAAGDFALLATEGEARDALVQRCPTVAHAGERVSSSRARRAVAAGEVATAWALLGRPFAWRGEVVRGDARGRQLGFPTANISAAHLVRPHNGVYAAKLECRVGLLDAVVNVGVRPTVDGERWQLEAHALDAPEAFSLYGESAAVHFVARLRDEQRFGGVDELKQQIARDCESARAALQAAPGLAHAGRHLVVADQRGG